MMKLKKNFFSFFKEPLGKILIEEKKKNFLLFLGVFFTNLFAAFSEGFSFGFMLAAVRFLERGKAVFTRNIWLIGEIHFTTKHVIFIFIFSAVMFQAIRSGLSYLGQIWAVFLSTKIQKRVQKNIYKQILKFSFRSVNKYKIGDLIEAANSPATAIPIFANSGYMAMVSLFTALILIVLMFNISMKLTLIVVTVIIALAFLQKHFVKKVSEISKKFTESQAIFTKSSVENLFAIRLIHTYHTHRHIYNRTKLDIENIAKIISRSSIYTNSVTPLNEVLSIVLLGICIVFGAQLTDRQVIPTLLTFLTITYRLGMRLQILSQNLVQIAGSIGYVNRMNNLLREEDKEYLPVGGKIFNGLKNEIVFKNVFLKYTKKRKPAVQNISFKIECGQTIGIVGPSGAGKSSILDLLLRLYDTSAGDILVDGQSLKKFDLSSWRKFFGVVSQENLVFNDTIENNIRFANEEAKYMDIIRAAKEANAYEFIRQLPKGFDTMVGERGHFLSGGERQRLALARAFLRDSEFLILDEATNNLDSHSEHLILEATKKFTKRKTIIIVAHRLSTISHADQIFLIENGQLVEQGTHKTLLEKDSRYAFYWKLQLAEKQTAKV